MPVSLMYVNVNNANTAEQHFGIFDTLSRSLCVVQLAPR